MTTACYTETILWLDPNIRTKRLKPHCSMQKHMAGLSKKRAGAPIAGGNYVALLTTVAAGKDFIASKVFGLHQRILRITQGY